MPDLIPVLIPQLNPNEREALLIDLRVQNGQKIQAGDALAVLETTKSTLELASDYAGYVLGLAFGRGDTVTAGEVLCYLGDAPDLPLPAAPQAPTKTAADELPAGLRITQPALALARSLGIGMDQLPRNTLVTEAVVRKFSPAAVVLPETAFDANGLIIYAAAATENRWWTWRGCSTRTAWLALWMTDCLPALKCSAFRCWAVVWFWRNCTRAVCGWQSMLWAELAIWPRA